jgi:hypothetical protein
MSSPCSGHGDTVLYGWGKDAPGMQLPDGVGFSVGPNTGIQTVVLQVRLGFTMDLSWGLRGLVVLGNAAPTVHL